MTVIIFLLLLILAFDVIILYSALCVGSDADEAEERLLNDKYGTDITDEEFEEAALKLFNEEMDPEEFLKIYNRKIESESSDDGIGFRPHEHI